MTQDARMKYVLASRVTNMLDTLKCYSTDISKRHFTLWKSEDTGQVFGLMNPHDRLKSGEGLYQLGYVLELRDTVLKLSRREISLETEDDTLTSAAFAVTADGHIAREP